MKTIRLRARVWGWKVRATRTMEMTEWNQRLATYFALGFLQIGRWRRDMNLIGNNLTRRTIRSSISTTRNMANPSLRRTAYGSRWIASDVCKSPHRWRHIGSPQRQGVGPRANRKQAREASNIIRKHRSSQIDPMSPLWGSGSDGATLPTACPVGY